MSLLTPRAPVLPIGALPHVDLLPPSERRRRDTMSRARTWVVVGIGALAVAALAIGGAAASNVAASLRLSVEQSRTTQILEGIAELSDVSAALSARLALTTMRRDAMSGDIAWSPALAMLAARLPAGVVITQYALDAGPAPVADSDPAAATGLSGTVTFTSTVPVDFVQTTRDLRTLSAVRSAEPEQLVSADGVFTYTVRLELDQSVYTGAYLPTEG